MKNASHAGFTLVETLVAIAIVTISLIGPLLTATRTLVSADIARDQLTASYLAQEGVEYVRSMRDSMYLADYAAYPSDQSLAGDTFCDFTDPDPVDDCNEPIPTGASGDSIATCLGAGSGTTFCQLNDPLATMGTGSYDNGVGDSLTVCPTNAASCAPLNLVGGRYTTGTGTATSFTRSITFYSIGSEIEVVVTVSWMDRGVPYSTSVTDYLSPWE